MAKKKKEEAYKWTEKEEKIVLDCLKRTGDNISDGLLIASEKLGTSKSVVQRKWYNDLSKRNTVFLLFSVSGEVMKNNRRRGSHVKVATGVYKYVSNLRKATNFEMMHIRELFKNKK